MEELELKIPEYKEIILVDVEEEKKNIKIYEGFEEISELGAKLENSYMDKPPPKNLLNEIMLTNKSKLLKQVKKE
jgi:hypothetical protein